MIKRLILLISIIAIASGWPVSAHLSCISPAEARINILKNFNGARIVAVVPDSVVESFIIRLNEIPPATKYVADRIIIYEKPNDRTAALTLYRNQCLVGSIIIPKAALRKLLPKNVYEAI